MNKIHISEHEGKMIGVRSISTSTMLNENCRRNAEIPGSICEKCYAKPLTELRPGLRKNLEENHRLLISRILDDDELPVIEDEIFRFESFADLNNVIQLENYLNIVRKNPGTRFTLWTKMYNLVYEYFKENPDVPTNFTLIISSLMVNKPLNADKFYELGAFRDGQLKVFTVYNLDYLREHDDVPITCGSRMCVKCKQCYSKTSIVYVNEILKSDQAKVETLLAFKHPEKAQKGNLLGELLMGTDEDDD